MNPWDTAELKALVEGLVFAAETPVKAERLAEVLDAERGLVLEALTALEEEYRLRQGGFLLVEVAEGFQFRTRPEHADWQRRPGPGRPFRFSRAAMETLAIIAYRQPITRAEIEYLRGVDSGGVVKTLLDKRLVRILGKKDVPGRPLMYGTAREFLTLFGLRDLGGLPPLKEFSELDLEAIDVGGAPAPADEASRAG